MARLPELAWRIPYWPKNYKNFIYPGLFYRVGEWQPKDALFEVEERLQALMAMPADSGQAKLMSQKILKQIEALVKIGQELKAQPKALNVPRGLTRALYIQALTEKKQALVKQHQALVQAQKKSAHAPAIQIELERIQAHLEQVEKLLTSA